MSQSQIGMLGRRSNTWWLAIGLSIPAIIIGRYDMVWLLLFAFAIMYTGGLATRTTKVKLAYRRKHAAKSMEGQFVPVDITIENQSQQNLFHLTVTDHFTSVGGDGFVHRVGHVDGHHSMLFG